MTPLRPSIYTATAVTCSSQQRYPGLAVCSSRCCGSSGRCNESYSAAIRPQGGALGTIRLRTSWFAGYGQDRLFLGTATAGLRWPQGTLFLFSPSDSLGTAWLQWSIRAALQLGTPLQQLMQLGSVKVCCSKHRAVAALLALCLLANMCGT